MDYCEYVVLIGQKTNQIITLSNQSNVLLERTWHRSNRLPYEVFIHAKFNTSAMNGMQIMAELKRGETRLQSSIVNFVLSSVNESGWTETFIANVAATNSGDGLFTGYINQATLGLNELSGREVYSVYVEVIRKRLKLKKKIFINHLGCYDSLIRLRQNIEHLEIEKVDE